MIYSQRGETDMKKAIVWLSIMALLLSISGLAEEKYYHVSTRVAKLLMAQEDNYIIVDVQLPSHYESRHIPGAINIPISTIGADGVAELPDLDQMIFVYGYFDNRSREAAALLADLGYTQVVEFGGLFLWTGDEEGLDVDDEYDDDPFEAREYGNPDDFYYDFYEEFDDYEEAEEYYYEHGGW